jgi:hypothetical protein
MISVAFVWFPVDTESVEVLIRDEWGAISDPDDL